MYEVTVKTGFSAAHQLRYYDGKYENLHGHNWIAIVVVAAEDLDEIGLGIDFVQLKKRTNDILKKLDYQNINKVPPFDKQNPSAENIARWVFKELETQINTGSVRVKRVEIKEFEECGAAYFE
ncbi:MAG: 6-carboxytetrahydropterin synthase [Nitrospinota bacterium]|nr:6-carboxytetrahydropterin synthase [Nitrospinota bacterium]